MFVGLIALMINANDVSGDISEKIAKYDARHECHQERVASYYSSKDEENCITVSMIKGDSGESASTQE